MFGLRLYDVYINVYSLSFNMSTRYLNEYMLDIFTSAPGFGGKIFLWKNMARDIKSDLVTLVVAISVQTTSN